MDKKGFFPMHKSHAFALVAFIVVSIIAFTGPVRNTVIAGLSLCGWILAGIAIAVPVYCMIIDYARYNKK